MICSKNVEGGTTNDVTTSRMMWTTTRSTRTRAWMPSMRARPLEYSDDRAQPLFALDPCAHRHHRQPYLGGINLSTPPTVHLQPLPAQESSTRRVRFVHHPKQARSDDLHRRLSEHRSRALAPWRVPWEQQAPEVIPLGRVPSGRRREDQRWVLVSQDRYLMDTIPADLAGSGSPRRWQDTIPGVRIWVRRMRTAIPTDPVCREHTAEQSLCRPMLCSGR